MTPELSEQLTSVTDRVKLLGELDLIKRSFFSLHAADSSGDLSAVGLSPTTIPFWSKLMASGNLNSTSIENLRQEIEHYSVLRVSLAFEPDAAFLKRLLTTFRTQSGQQSSILSIEVIPGISAGLIYSLAGKIVDCSLEKKMKSLDLASLISAKLPLLSS